MEALLDTSFLMLIAELGRDIISIIEDRLDDRLEPVVIKSVIDELVEISRRGGKRALLAKTALEVASSMKRIDGGIDVSTDEQLVRLSREMDVMVITSDFEMSRRLRESGCRYIYVNKKGEVFLNL